MTTHGILSSVQAIGEQTGHSSVTVQVGTDAAACRLEDGTLDRFAVAEMLRAAADAVENYDEFGTVRDVNGNIAAAFAVVEH